MNDGLVQLPTLVHDPNSPDVRLRFLGDSGCADHDADHQKPFPGATLRESDGQRTGQTYTCANGSETKNGGEFEVQVKLGNALNKSIFQNAPVGMQIFSRNKIAREKHRITLEDDHGTILHKPTGEIYTFIAAMGVYCIEILVPRTYVNPDDPIIQGFARHGAAP